MVFFIKPSEVGLFQVVCEKDMFLSSGVSHQPPRLLWFINPSPGRGRWIPRRWRGRRKGSKPLAGEGGSPAVGGGDGIPRRWRGRRKGSKPLAGEGGSPAVGGGDEGVGGGRQKNIESGKILNL